MKLKTLIENRINISQGKTQLADNWYQHLAKYVKTKGIWNSVQKNLHDIMKVEPDGRISDGTIIYKNLETILSHLEHGSGFSTLNKRNNISRKTLVRAIKDFLAKN